MSQLTINALKINIVTNKGVFGTFSNFVKGLNVVRAKNSTGKSSYINSILYALGVEELLGGTNGKTMKPVLREELTYQNNSYRVIESNVELQISNANNDSITIRRWITSATREERLIEVEFGPSLTEGKKFKKQDYYVHLSGSAQNEAGFHSFLVEYLGWELPFVPSFEGKERLLYIQTLFPLFFIEQIKGWSSFYAQTNTNYGIRELSTRAIEFILGLDVLSNSKLKEKLRIEKALITQEWSNLVTLIKEKADAVAATVVGLSDKPDLLSNYEIFVYDKNQNLISLREKISESVLEYNQRSNVVRSIKDIEKEHEAKINEVEDKVLALQSEANSIRQDIYASTINQSTLEENLVQLQQDLKSNQDAKKLLDLGSDKNLYVAKGICPTCNQKIHETLLPQDIEFQPMTLEENIKYIKDQLATLKFAISQSKGVTNEKNKRYRAVSEALEEERRRVRGLKLELREDPRMLSNLDIEETLNLKWKIKELEETENSFEEILKKLETLKQQWQQHLIETTKIPEEFFSKLDKTKLEALQKKFRYYLEQFGYSSTLLEDITISHDKFTPVVRGFDIRFDSSASDYIRLRWAFALVLNFISNQYGGNHPKLIIMDEPGQQQMNINSTGKLFELLSGLEGQSIIASSLTLKEIEGVTVGVPVNVIDLGDDYIMKPLLS
ncbi:hypothetical protein NYE59_07180 [Paenibacillus sp. FSL L8-0323]|uniref:hypothetical protein n=1 Tax=Paenibacillus TaxID=44249 RepID=UPI00096DA342|nr:hypothetical protein [Paenibacillus odorifer]OMD13024.1 hypothetical protein BJP47_25190 [Paenibacillus odorifer]OMD21070.1 hypothetical protein BJP48_09500 [Paenibacillus odorifer]